MMMEIDPSVLLKSLTNESKQRLEEIRSKKAEQNFQRLLEEASDRLDDPEK